MTINSKRFSHFVLNDAKIIRLNNDKNDNDVDNY
jgi:hypothetical protein